MCCASFGEQHAVRQRIGLGAPAIQMRLLDEAGMRQDHALNGVDRASSFSDCDRKTASPGFATRLERHLIHVNEMLAQRFEVHLGPVGLGIRLENLDNLLNGTERVLARLGCLDGRGLRAVHACHVVPHHARHLVAAGHVLIHHRSAGLALLRGGAERRSDSGDGESGGNRAMMGEGGHGNLAKQETLRDVIGVIAAPDAARAAEVTTAFWSAVSADARRVEDEGRTASEFAGSQLWPLHLIGPEPLMSLWNEMEAALLAEKQDWMVWTTWYRDRLAGYPRDEKREFAYLQIEEALWKQGPAVVNAEIKRRIEELEPPPPVRHAAPFRDSRGMAIVGCGAADAAVRATERRYAACSD
jgi:hypothetical protein